MKEFPLIHKFLELIRRILGSSIADESFWDAVSLEYLLHFHNDFFGSQIVESFYFGIVAVIVDNYQIMLTSYLEYI